jgi:simple sugar transport system ATP-binding protein
VNADTPVALELEGIVKRFGAVQALDDASLVVRAGSVHALLGENGAGKTTLMRIAYGLVRPDAGIVRVAGRRTRLDTPRDALVAGIGMVQQHFSLVPAMTVAENVALGGRGSYDARAARARVADLSERTGLAADPGAIVGRLPVSAQQRVEILKALSRDVRVLILDEPTAVLAPDDAAALLRWARDFASSDRAVVLITHKLRDALANADDVTILRQGRVVRAARADTLDDLSLAAAMLGDARDPIDAKPHAADTAVRRHRGIAVARLDGVTVLGSASLPVLRDVTVAAHEGEILGIAAVEGNGERELLRTFAGRLNASSGTVMLPRHVGYIPQDRHADAIADDMSLTENLALHDAGIRRGLISWGARRVETARLLDRYEVRAAGPDTSISTLSGGNQQRLVLARELSSSPELLVADQPTRGLDVRATADVHQRLRAARDAGAAVVVHSSDLDEVLTLADRVVVVANGSVREVAGDRERVGRAMLGIFA